MRTERKVHKIGCIQGGMAALTSVDFCGNGLLSGIVSQINLSPLKCFYRGHWSQSQGKETMMGTKFCRVWHFNINELSERKKEGRKADCQHLALAQFLNS